jgi:hypothetical protein
MMTAARLNQRGTRAGLMCVAALASIAMQGSALARGTEGCTPRAARPLAAFVEPQHGTGLLAAARMLSNNRSLAQNDPDRGQPLREIADPLSATALQIRIARYRISPQELDFQQATASVTEESPRPTPCQRGG